MKNIFLIALSTLIFFSCSKSKKDNVTPPKLQDEVVVSKDQLLANTSNALQRKFVCELGVKRCSLAYSNLISIKKDGLLFGSFETIIIDTFDKTSELKSITLNFDSSKEQMLQVIEEHTAIRGEDHRITVLENDATRQLGISFDCASEFENCKKASELLVDIKNQGKLEGTFKRIKVTWYDNIDYASSITLDFKNTTEKMLEVIKKHAEARSSEEKIKALETEVTAKLGMTFDCYSEFENCKKASELLVDIKNQGKLEGTFKRIKVTWYDNIDYASSITLDFQNSTEKMLEVIKQHNVEHGVID